MRAGYAGAFAAWIGFTLPSALLLILFAYGAGALGGPAGVGLLHGLKLVAVAIVAQAIWGMQAVPGPLFTFSAYLGTVANIAPHGFAGAALGLIGIFLPGILILLGPLPFRDSFRKRPNAQAMMRGVSAAVDGLLGAALCNPVWTSAVKPLGDFGIALVGFVLLTMWRAPPPLVVGMSAFGGSGLAIVKLGANERDIRALLPVSRSSARTKTHPQGPVSSRCGKTFHKKHIRASGVPATPLRYAFAMNAEVTEQPATGLRAMPRGVWALGLVSLFMDISSEMIHGLLPVFLTTALGASAEMVGLVEGVGEATASISKLFSGWLSDKLGKRKALTILGYGLGALSKPLFAIAPTAQLVLGARFSDRVGKGIRGAPRDAMLGDMAPAGQRGAAYGLRQALDTVGAFTGPLLAIAFMAVLHDNFRLIFWIALIPGLISVLVLVLGVTEPPHPANGAQIPVKLADLKSVGAGYWTVVAVGAVLTLARFSEAFLILRAQNAGLSLAFAPLVLVVMNIVYALSSYPLGALSDRIDRKLMLALGFGALIVADIVLAAAPTLTIVMVGVALWGLHMGMTQGLLSALVADEAPANLRATAFGVFNFASGIALLLASVTAGFLWEQIGPAATFLAGAVFTTFGLLTLFLTRNANPVK